MIITPEIMLKSLLNEKNLIHFMSCFFFAQKPSQPTHRRKLPKRLYNQNINCRAQDVKVTKYDVATLMLHHMLTRDITDKQIQMLNFYQSLPCEIGLLIIKVPRSCSKSEGHPNLMNKLTLNESTIIQSRPAKIKVIEW